MDGSFDAASLFPPVSHCLVKPYLHIVPGAYCLMHGRLVDQKQLAVTDNLPAMNVSPIMIQCFIICALCKQELWMEEKSIHLDTCEYQNTLTEGELAITQYNLLNKAKCSVWVCSAVGAH